MRAVTLCALLGAQLAFLAATALSVAYAPLPAAALALLDTARAMGSLLPCLLAAVGLLWAFAWFSFPPPPGEEASCSSSSSWRLRFLQQEWGRFAAIAAWHLLFTLGLGWLVAWGTAESLCDPLVRSVWLRASTSTPPLLLHQVEEGADEVEPLSVVTRPLRFPTFTFVGEDAHLRLSFDDSGGALRRCAAHDTEAIVMGRKAVTAAVLVLLVSVLFGMAQLGWFIQTQKAAVAPPPVPARAPPTLFVLRPTTTKGGKEGQQRGTAAAVMLSLTIVVRTMVAAVMLAGLTIMGMLNDVDAWDWRALYLLLLATALATYLVAGLSLVVVTQGAVVAREEEELAFIWLSIPLIAARAAHALLAPDFFFEAFC